MTLKSIFFRHQLDLEQEDVLAAILYSGIWGKDQGGGDKNCCHYCKLLAKIAFLNKLNKLPPVHTWALCLSKLSGMDQDFLRGFFS